MPFEDELRRLARSDPAFRDPSVARDLKKQGDGLKKEVRAKFEAAFKQYLDTVGVKAWICQVAHTYHTHISSAQTGILWLQADPLGWDFETAAYFSFVPAAIGKNLIRFSVSMKARTSPLEYSDADYRFLFLPPSRHIHQDPRSDQVHKHLLLADLINPGLIANVIKCLAVKDYNLGKAQLDTVESCGGANFDPQS